MPTAGDNGETTTTTIGEADASTALQSSLAPATGGASMTSLGESAERAALEMQTKLQISALPVRQYLESSVVPILLQGLQTLVKVNTILLY